MARKAKTEERSIVQSFYITTAKYTFTADEKRILTHLIETMQPMLEGLKLNGKQVAERNLWGDYHFILPTSFFTNNSELSINRQRVKDAIRALNNKKFEIDDGNIWRICRLIEMPALDKRGVIEFYLTNELVNVFLDFSKGYSKYQLSVSLSLDNVYAQRFYELVSNQSRPMTYNLDKLREMFGTTKAYNRAYNFILRVVKPAKKELDAKANWSFEYKLDKQGNAYKNITLYPIHYPERESEGVQEAELKRQVQLSGFFAREVRYFLTDCGFTAREMKNNAEIIQQFTAMYQQNARAKLTEMWERAATARNRKAYLIGSIKNEVANG